MVIWNAFPVNIKTALSLNGFKIQVNLGNQSVHADSVKPFYKRWALLILQNKVFFSVSTLSFWFLTRFYIFCCISFLVYNVYPFIYS